MKIGKQLVLPVLIIVSGFGVLTSAQAPKDGSKAATKKARVFFIEPKNGATVTSPVHMKFGSEGIEIAAVPPGDLTKEQVRPGKAHYHVGIDQSCLPSGQVIVKGTPSWVHFGTGNNTIDTQLEPGKHKLTLQLGDDLHRTVNNLCETINITVEK